MTETNAEPETIDEDCVTENPYCDELVGPESRPCVRDAGHEVACIPMPYSRDEKIDYLYDQAKALETLIEQAGPLLEQAGPLLATFAGGQGSSPLGRIAGSLFR